MKSYQHPYHNGLRYHNYPETMRSCNRGTSVRLVCLAMLVMFWPLVMYVVFCLPYLWITGDLNEMVKRFKED